MRRAMAWLPAGAYMATTWWLSSAPRHVDLSMVPFRDKGVHFLQYAVLGVLLAFALRTTWPERRGLPQYVIATAMAAAFGFIDELHQALVPGRFSSAGDLAADTLGATAGALVFAVCVRLGRRYRTR